MLQYSSVGGGAISACVSTMKWRPGGALLEGQCASEWASIETTHSAWPTCHSRRAKHRGRNWNSFVFHRAFGVANGVWKAGIGGSLQNTYRRDVVYLLKFLRVSLHFWSKRHRGFAEIHSCFLAFLKRQRSFAEIPSCFLVFLIGETSKFCWNSIMFPCAFDRGDIGVLLKFLHVSLRFWSKRHQRFAEIPSCFHVSALANSR